MLNYDTCLVEKADNALQLDLKLNQNHRLIHEWTTANLITVNAQKSLVLIIFLQKKVSNIKYLPRFFCINHSRISQIPGHSYRQKLKFFWNIFVFLKQKFPNLLAL